MIGEKQILRILRQGSLLSSVLAPSLIQAAGVPATGAPDCFNGTSVVSCAEAVSPAMNYTKLDGAGTPLDSMATTWACVRDNVTGLIWETKTGDGNIRDMAHRYAWFDANPNRNGGAAGGVGTTTSCGNSLGGLACTTANYIDAVNASNLCGANDWRLPSQMELLSLIHAGATYPAINIALFPHTAIVPYWSASTHAMMPASAWGAHFGYGASHAETKAATNAVRVVRGTWRP